MILFNYYKCRLGTNRNYAHIINIRMTLSPHQIEYLGTDQCYKVLFLHYFPRNLYHHLIWQGWYKICF